MNDFGDQLSALDDRRGGRTAVGRAPAAEFRERSIVFSAAVFSAAETIAGRRQRQLLLFLQPKRIYSISETCKYAYNTAVHDVSDR